MNDMKRYYSFVQFKAVNAGVIKTLISSTVMASMLSACFSSSVEKRNTLADLSLAPLEYEKADSIAPEKFKAVENYQDYLEKTAFKTHYAEALRRVADLKLEISEEKKSLTEGDIEVSQAIMTSSIEHYNTYLRTYPGHEKNDLIFYQLAKAYSMTGDLDKAMEAMDAIVKDYSKSQHIDEVQFRRGEILFVLRDYAQAEQAYASVVNKNFKTPLQEKASYKLGWSQFKQSKYTQTLKTYFDLLDSKVSENKIGQYGITEGLTNSEKDFIIDSLRVVSLSLSYQEGHKTIDKMFKPGSKKLYEPLIYKQLGDLYSKKERYNDAAETFMAFTKKYPQSFLSPGFHTMTLQVYADGKMSEKILPSKMLFVNNYGVRTKFWLSQTAENQNIIRPQLKKHIQELAQHFHATATKSKKLKDYQLAATWYRKYLSSFPNDKDAANINFLLAESLYDGQLYSQALLEYEKSAYHYPAHKKSAEAAYAILLTYNELLKKAKPDQLNQLKLKALSSAIKFSNAFPNDPHAPAVITKTAENLLQSKNYKLASEFAERIITNKNIKKAEFKRTAWIVFAHAQFELAQYDVAEQSYKSVLTRIPGKTKSDIHLRKELTDKLAASIYKQGEVAKTKGDNKLAAYHFLRLGKEVPSSPIRLTAEYDAATLYMQLKDWPAAQKILENFRKQFPGNKQYVQGVSSKLALIYTETGQFTKAAKEIALLSSLAKTPEERRKLVWESAEMYEKAGHVDKANEQYQKYVKKYPKPFLQSIEAHNRIAEYYKKKKSAKLRTQWMKKLIAAEKLGKKQRNDRSRYLAASAVFELAQPVMRSFTQVKLKIPLKKSMGVKKKRMKSAISAFKNVLSYQVAEFTTASTYQTAEIYNHLAHSLMDSQRPKGLSADELEQYDVLLEEQAYPFEEKSIEIHGSNIKRTSQGIYDKWIKKSMSVLAEIQPVRYAKHEKIEPYVLITQ